MIRQESKRAPVAGPTAIRRCGIALGSNLGDRLANLQLAAKAVKMLADFSQPVFQAPVFETDPVGCAPGTPAFLNSVMEIGFFGEPEELLARLRAVESAMGRPSTREKNEPRPIDLDILYADGLVRTDPALELPHPRLPQRRFVLEPLSAIRPGLVLPGQDVNIAALLAALPEGDAPLRKFADTW